MEFREVYDRFIDDIKVTALSQRVPGHDYDDVVSEMTTCLWKAWQTYDPDRGRLGPYWWSLWLNRKTDLLIAASRLKRPEQVLTDEMEEREYRMELVPLPPKKSGQVAKAVWMMLAAGEQVKDIVSCTGLSRRGYYTLISNWRTGEIRDYLKG